jgi:hypothetical protein
MVFEPCDHEKTASIFVARSKNFSVCFFYSVLGAWHSCDKLLLSLLVCPSCACICAASSGWISVKFDMGVFVKICRETLMFG